MMVSSGPILLGSHLEVRLEIPSSLLLAKLQEPCDITEGYCNSNPFS